MQPSHCNIFYEENKHSSQKFKQEDKQEKFLVFQGRNWLKFLKNQKKALQPCYGQDGKGTDDFKTFYFFNLKIC